MVRRRLAQVFAIVAAVACVPSVAQADAIVDLTVAAPSALSTQERPLDAAVDGRGSLTTVWTQTDPTGTHRVRSLTVQPDGTRHPIQTLSEPLALQNGADQWPKVAGRPGGGAAVVWAAPLTVAVLDRDGEPIARRKLGFGAGYNTPGIAVASSGDIYVAGGTPQGLQLSRLNAQGEVEWSRLLDGVSDGIEATVDVTASGKVRVAWSVDSAVWFASADAQGVVGDPVKVMTGTPGGSSFRQLAVAGTDTAPVVAAFDCFNNGAGHPCWSYNVGFRVIRNGAPQCLIAIWAADSICGAPASGAQSPVAVTTGEGHTLLAWTQRESSGGGIYGLSLDAAGLLYRGEDSASTSASSAIRAFSGLGQRPEASGVYGNYLSAGRSGDDEASLAWRSRGEAGESPSMGFAVSWRPGSLVGPSAATNVSAGGSAVSRPVVAQPPRWAVASSALVWAREVGGQGRMLQASWLSDAQKPFRDLTMSTDWSAAKLSSDSDDATTATAPALAVTLAGRAVTAWWRDLGSSRWRLQISGMDRREVPAPVVSLDEALAYPEPRPPQVMELGSGRAVVLWTGSDAVGYPVARSALVGADGRVGAPRDLAGPNTVILGVSRAGTATPQLFWRDSDGHFRRSALTDDGLVTGNVTVDLPADAGSPIFVALPGGRSRAFWSGPSASSISVGLWSVEVGASGSPVGVPARLADTSIPYSSVTIAAEAGADGTIGVIAQFAGSGSSTPVFDAQGLRIEPSGKAGQSKQLGPMLTGQRGGIAVTVQDGIVTTAAALSPDYNAPTEIRVAVITADDRLEFAHEISRTPEPTAKDPHPGPRINGPFMLTRGPLGSPLLFRSTTDSDGERFADVLSVAGLFETAVFPDAALLGDVGAPKPLGQSAGSPATLAGDVVGASNAANDQTFAAWRDGSAGIRIARLTSAGASAFNEPPRHNGLQCPAVWVLQARGSGETGESDLLNRFSGRTKTQNGRLLQLLDARGVSDVRVSDVAYPAVSVPRAIGSALQQPGALLAFQPPGDYFPSVARGVDALKAELQAITDDCGKRTKFVLTGYSQGAEVVGDAVQQSGAAVQVRILATVLFADPRFNPRESTAVRGSFEPLRNGLFGPRAPTLVDDVNGNLVLSYCRRFDPVCQGFAPGCIEIKATQGDGSGSNVDATPVHGSYAEIEPWPLPSDRYLIDALDLLTANFGWQKLMLSVIGPPFTACSAGGRATAAVGPPDSPGAAAQDAAKVTAAAVAQAINGAAVSAPSRIASVASVEEPPATTPDAPEPLVARIDGAEQGGLRVRPGDEFTLSGASSTAPEPGIARLDWDLDGDGSYEQFGVDRVVTARLTAQPSGPLHLRVRDYDGHTAVASVNVEVTASAPTAPGPPRAVSAEPSPGGFIVRWDAPASDGGSPVRRYRVTSGDHAITVVADGTARSATFHDLDPGVARGFSVIAISAAGSSIAAAVTDPVVAGDVPPTTPEPTTPVPTTPEPTTPVPTTPVPTTPVPTTPVPTTPVPDDPKKPDEKPSTPDVPRSTIPDAPGETKTDPPPVTPPQTTNTPTVTLKAQALKRATVGKTRRLAVDWSQLATGNVLVVVRVDAATAKRLKLKVPHGATSLELVRATIKGTVGAGTTKLLLGRAVAAAIKKSRKPVKLEIEVSLDGGAPALATLTVG